MIQAEYLVTYFMDSKKSLSQRIFVLVTLLSLTFWVNDVMQFTHHFRLKNKMEIFKELTRVINEPKMDSASKNEAAALRKELLEGAPLYSEIYSSLFLKLNGGFAKSTNMAKASPRQINMQMTTQSMMFVIQSYFKLIMSTSGIFFFVGLLMISVVVMKSKGDLLDTLAYASVLFFFLIIAVFAISILILSMSPNGVGVENSYLFNVMIQFLLFVCISTVLMFLKNRY
ncbi:hypothetical protein [Chitinophaga caseinilytica]|uniref:Uncharacterized protein n=1 Tax=Chitinophaga caseinilytica TaxID=2267521 RepID=A0ABZ2Z5S4_9BACT